MKQKMFKRAVSVGLCTTIFATSGVIPNIETVKAQTGEISMDTFMSIIEPVGTQELDLTSGMVSPSDIEAQGTFYSYNSDSKSIDIDGDIIDFYEDSEDPTALTACMPDGCNYKFTSDMEILGAYCYNDIYYPYIKQGSEEKVLFSFTNSYPITEKLRALSADEANAEVNKPDYSRFYTDEYECSYVSESLQDGVLYNDYISVIDRDVRVELSGDDLSVEYSWGHSTDYYTVPAGYDRIENIYADEDNAYPRIYNSNTGEYMILGAENSEVIDVMTEDFKEVTGGALPIKVGTSEVFKRNDSEYGITTSKYGSSAYLSLETSGPLYYKKLNGRLVLKDSNGNYYLTDFTSGRFSVPDLLENGGTVESITPDKNVIVISENGVAETYISSQHINEIVGMTVAKNPGYEKLSNINVSTIGEDTFFVNNSVVVKKDGVGKNDLLPTQSNKQNINEKDNPILFNGKYKMDAYLALSAYDFKYQFYLGTDLKDQSSLNAYDYISNDGYVYFVTDIVADDSETKILTKSAYNISDEMDNINTIIKASKDSLVYITNDNKLASIGTGDNFNSFKRAYNNLNLNCNFVTLNNQVYMISDGHIYKAEIGDYAIAQGYGSNYSVDGSTGEITVTKGGHVASIKDPNGDVHTENSFTVSVAKKGYYEFLETFDYGAEKSKIIRVSLNKDTENKPEISAVNGSIIFSGLKDIEYSADGSTWADYTDAISYTTPLYVRYKDVANAQIQYVTLENGSLSVDDVINTGSTADSLANFFHINNEGELILLPGLDEGVSDMFETDEYNRLLDTNLNVIKDVQSAYTRIKKDSGLSSDGSEDPYASNTEQAKQGSDRGVYTYVDKNGNVISSDYRYFAVETNKDKISLTDKIKAFFLEGYSYLTDSEGNVSKVRDDSTEKQSDMCELSGSVENVFNSYYKVNGTVLEPMIGSGESVEVSTGDNYKVEDGKLKVKYKNTDTYTDVDTSEISGTYDTLSSVSVSSENDSTYNDSCDFEVAIFDSQRTNGSYARKIERTTGTDKEGIERALSMGEGYYYYEENPYEDNAENGILFLERPQTSEKARTSGYNYGVYYNRDMERERIKDYVLANQDKVKKLTDYSNQFKTENNGSDNRIFFNINNSDEYCYYIVSKDGEKQELITSKGFELSEFENGIFKDGFMIAAVNKLDSCILGEGKVYAIRNIPNDYWNKTTKTKNGYIDAFFSVGNDITYKIDYIAGTDEIKTYKYRSILNDTVKKISTKNPNWLGYGWKDIGKQVSYYTNEQLDEIVKSSGKKNYTVNLSQKSLKQSDSSIYVQDSYSLKFSTDAENQLYIPYRYNNENASILLYGKTATGNILLKEYSAKDLKEALYTDSAKDKKYIRTDILKKYDTDNVGFTDYELVYINNDREEEEHKDNTGFSAFDVEIQKFNNSSNENCPRFKFCQKISSPESFLNSYNYNWVDVSEAYSLVDEEDNIYIYYPASGGEWYKTGEKLDSNSMDITCNVSNTNWTNSPVDISASISNGALSSIEIKEEGQQTEAEYNISDCIQQEGNTIVYNGKKLTLYSNGVEDSNVNNLGNYLEGAYVYVPSNTDKYINVNDRRYSNPENILKKYSYTGTYVLASEDGKVLSCQSYNKGIPDNSLVLSNQKSVTGNGTYEIQAVDGKGNTYINKVKIKNIDRLAPSLKAEKAGTNQITLSGKDADETDTDGCSGIKKIYYSLSKPVSSDVSEDSLDVSDFVDSEWKEYNGEVIKYDPTGARSRARTADVITTTSPYVYAYAEDNAGNISDINILEIGGKLDVDDIVIYENGKTTVNFAGQDRSQAMFGADKDNHKIDFTYKVENGSSQSVDSGISNSYDLSFTDTEMGLFNVSTNAVKYLSSGFARTGEDSVDLSVIYVDKPAISGGTTIKIADAIVKNDTVDSTYYRYVNALGSENIEDKEFKKYEGDISVAPGTYKVQAYTVSKNYAIEGDVNEATISVSATAIDIIDELEYENGKTNVTFKTGNPKSGVTYSYSYEIDGKTTAGDKYSVTEDTQVKMMGVGTDNSTGSLTDNIKVVKADKPAISDVPKNGKTVKITQGRIINDELDSIEYKIDNGDWKTYKADSEIEIPVGKHTVYARQKTLTHKFVTESEREVYVSDLKITHKLKHKNGSTILSFNDKNPEAKVTYSYDGNPGNKVEVNKDATVIIKEEDDLGNTDEASVDVTVTNTDMPVISDVKPNGNTVTIDAGKIENGTLQGIMYSVDGALIYSVYTSEIELSVGEHTIRAYQVVIPKGQQDEEDIVLSEIASKVVKVKDPNIAYEIKYSNGLSVLTFNDAKEPDAYTYSYDIDSKISQGNVISVTETTDAILKEIDNAGNSNETKAHINVVYSDKPDIAVNRKTVNITAGDVKGDEVDKIYTRINGGEWSNETSFTLKPGKYTVESYQTTKNYKITSDVATKEITIAEDEALCNIKYVDKEGNSLANEESVSGNVGDTVSAIAKEIKGYTPDNTSKTIVLKESGNEIIFVYDKNSYDYVVKYVDEDNNKLSEDKKSKASYKDIITEEAIDIKGYVPIVDSKKITIDTEGNEIIFTYKKGEYSYIVKYIDKDGKELANSIKSKAKYKDTVTEKARKIKGYSPDANKKSLVINTENNVITFIYDKSSYGYVVKYVDEDGNKLADDKSAKAVYESVVTEKAIDIKGYKPVKDSQKLKIDTLSNEIEFVYKKRSYDYTVRYVDENGKDLADSVIKKAKYKDTVTEKAVDVKGYVPDVSKKSLTIDTENNEIVFNYIKGGYNYTVKYVDEDGNELIDSVTKGAKYKDVVKEDAASITGYKPDKNKKSITIDTEGNEIVFHYKKNSYGYTIKICSLDGVILKEIAGKEKYHNTVTVEEKLCDVTGYRLDNIPEDSKEIYIVEDESKNVVTVYYRKIDEQREKVVKTGDKISKGLLGLFTGSLAVFFATSKKRKKDEETQS